MWRFGSFANEQGLIRNKADEALSWELVRAVSVAGAVYQFKLSCRMMRSFILTSTTRYESG
jgi:hypothetical protein